MEHYDCVIIGSGPAGLGAAFHLKKQRPGISVLVLDKEKISTGGLRNDCKMNFTFPIGFPPDYWQREQADEYLKEVSAYLKPDIMEKRNLSVYTNRAQRLGVELVAGKQAHLGTDGGILLIKMLMEQLESARVAISLEEEMLEIAYDKQMIVTNRRQIGFNHLIIAPGRKGSRFLQKIMNTLGVTYMDHILDVGIRIESKEVYYPIVKDYYDPKFLFPDKTRTFCTNSGCAKVVREKYLARDGRSYYIVNGHAYSGRQKPNGLVNFAVLKTLRLTEPLASGQEFGEMLGKQAMLLGGDRPIMQRVGDFRLGKRSKQETFTQDLYDFAPTLKNCTPGDISLAMPAKVLRSIWKSMKLLDTIIPGVLHPSTIMYYPEIKMYTNRPQFITPYFAIKENIYVIGDGAGTSRGITAAWASGIRAADGILGN